MVENPSSGSGRDSESVIGRQDNEAERSQDTNTITRSGENVAYTNGSQCQRNSSAIRTSAKYSDIGGPSWWKPEPDVGRVANGVPRRSHRLKQLGNAVVPQVVEQIAKSIWRIEYETN
jgi:DNA (cytosine-5)-methyltransferase 1